MPPLFTDPAQRIVDDLNTCFLPKVRILNGIHTIMVAILGLLCGAFLNT